MGKFIVSISNKMQRYTVYLFLETALRVSVGTSTHHQERIQLCLQHMISVTPLLLSAAIVEELEPVLVCCGGRTSKTIRHLTYILQLLAVLFHLYMILCMSSRQSLLNFTNSFAGILSQLISTLRT
jgi:hypothetical protein